MMVLGIIMCIVGFLGLSASVICEMKSLKTPMFRILLVVVSGLFLAGGIAIVNGSDNEPQQIEVQR